MTSIPLSPAHTAFHESRHDYGGIFVQGGTRGRVFVRGGDSYTTAFVECAPPGSFIRGEGATLAEADDACWAKLQAYLRCGEHEWEARGYRNGGGFCTRCGQFGSKVFTPGQLGLFCAECGVPTFHTLGGRRSAESRCEPHDPIWPYVVGSIKAASSDAAEAEEMYRRLSSVARHGAPADPEALEWAYAHLDMTDAPR